MPDVEGQWDFYPNLRLKIIFSKWLNCAVSFVKFDTLSRSGGTQIPNADIYNNLYNTFYLHTSTAGTSVTYPRAKKIISLINDGGMPMDPPLYSSTTTFKVQQNS